MEDAEEEVKVEEVKVEEVEEESKEEGIHIGKNKII